MQVNNTQNSSQSLLPLTGTLNTEKTSNAFFVPQSSDEEFNARMIENELDPNNLRDIHTQKFMDRGFEKDKAAQRVSQYAFMGALDIPGQLSVFNQFFDKNAPEDVKDTFRETLKSSFDNMSAQEIGLATAEMLSTIETPGLTHVSSQALIKNPVVPIDLSQIMKMSPEEREEYHTKALRKEHDFFILGQKIFHDQDEQDGTNTSVNKPELSSLDSIRNYFTDIIERLTNKENHPETEESEKKSVTRSKDIFEYVLQKLTHAEKEKLEENEKNELIVEQYTKNNKPNPMKEENL